MNYFFDLDGTLTESWSEITSKLFDVLNHIRTKVIISGADERQMRSQLAGLRCSVMSQNGNINDLWKRLLTPEEKAKIHAHIALYSPHLMNDKVEDRGAQISYSCVGHHSNLDVKKAFDPSREKRREILAKYPPPEGIEINIAGTTCLDYFPTGLNKAANILRYMELKKWKRRECVYIGDALVPGGNDESMIGVLPTLQVKNWQETHKYLTT